MDLRTLGMGRFLCLIVYWISSGTAAAQGQAPDGYLSVGSDRFPPSDTPHVYNYYDGDTADFTCTATVGDHVELSYSGRDWKSDPPSQGPNAVSLRRRLVAASSGALVNCVIKFTADPRAQVVATLSLQLGKGKRGVNVWVIVFSVVVVVLVAGGAIWLWASYRNKKLNNKSSHMVTFADRHSIENLNPRTQEQPAGEATRASGQQVDPTPGSGRGGETTNALVQHSEPV